MESSGPSRCAPSRTPGRTSVRAHLSAASVPAISPLRRRGPTAPKDAAMKTALLLLVVLAAAAGPAQALRCHVCTSSANCRNPQSCPVNSRYCRTLTKVEPLTGNLVEKNCVESCMPTSNMPGQVSSGTAATLCCQGDLCNEKLNSASARTPLPSTTLGLLLALGLLALILGPSL